MRTKSIELFAAIVPLWGFFVLGLSGCGNNQKPVEEHPEVAAASSEIDSKRPVVLPSDVLATVNGVPISKADLQGRLNELKAIVEGAGQPWQELNTEQLTKMLDEVIDSEVLSQSAVKEGLSEQTDVRRRWRTVRRQFLSQEWLRNARDSISVDAEAIKQFYAENKEQFKEPEQLKLRQIVVQTEEEAKSIEKTLADGQIPFAELATSLSVGPTAADGGIFPFTVMRAGDLFNLFQSANDAEDAGIMALDPVLEEAVFSIEQPGESSSYVKGPDDRYHMFQLVERTKGSYRSLNEVWDSINAYLTLQRLQERVQDVRSQATIERFADRLEDLTQ